MTKRICAINMLRPHVKILPMVESDTLAQYVADRANLSVSDVSHALRELHFAVLWFCALGHSVKLDGLGVYRPDIELSGARTIHYRIDRGLLRGINLGPFHAIVENSAAIGKTPDELVTIWNENHPYDLVEE